MGGVAQCVGGAFCDTSGLLGGEAAPLAPTGVRFSRPLGQYYDRLSNHRQVQKFNPDNISYFVSKISEETLNIQTYTKITFNMLKFNILFSNLAKLESN